jgi:hypothetical protein
MEQRFLLKLSSVCSDGVALGLIEHLALHGSVQRHRVLLGGCGKELAETTAVDAVPVERCLRSQFAHFICY